MRRHFIFILMIVVVLLSSCQSEAADVSIGSDSSQAKGTAGLFRVECVGRDGSFRYYRDVTTDVMYLWVQSSGSGSASGFSIMMDPETGLPLTHARYMEIANESSTASIPNAS